MTAANPRIALVAHDIHDGGGMERACAELIRHAHSQFDFHVVSAGLAPDLRPLVAMWRRVWVPRRPFPVKYAVFWVRAGWVLRNLDVDLVHTVGAIVPNSVDLATISFCHAGYVGEARRLVPKGTTLVRRINRGAGRLLGLCGEWWLYRPDRLRTFGAVSQGVAQELSRHYPEVPYELTPNGVDLDRFQPNTELRVQFRRAERTSQDTVVALFVGGDWDHKGLSLAIGGVAGARAAGAPVELWIVGDGDVDRFTRLSRTLGVSSYVRFYGRRNDTELFYQSADLFVFPSSYETFSLVCFEAAASALPLVIPPISGARQIVGLDEGGDEGGYIVERSVESVAAALTKLAGNSTLRSALGAEARRRAQSYGWDRSAASVIRLYQQLITGQDGEGRR